MDKEWTLHLKVLGQFNSHGCWKPSVFYISSSGTWCSVLMVGIFKPKVWSWVIQSYRSLSGCLKEWESNWETKQESWIPFLLFLIFFWFDLKVSRSVYSFASLSHNYFIAQKQVSSRGLFFVKKQTLYLLNVHSLFVRSLLLLHKQACSVLDLKVSLIGVFNLYSFVLFTLSHNQFGFILSFRKRNKKTST